VAQIPPKGPDAKPVTNQALEAKVDIDLRDFYNRLQNRATELLKSAPPGLSNEALADYVEQGLRDLSAAPIEQAGRAATAEANSLGRNLEAQRRGPQIGQAVRSAILDAATCDNCFPLDGAVCEINGPVVDISAQGAAVMEREGYSPSSPDAYFVLMPPNFCEGEDYCRCLFLYRVAA
jgi:hypothetical protein